MFLTRRAAPRRGRGCEAGSPGPAAWRGSARAPPWCCRPGRSLWPRNIRCSGTGPSVLRIHATSTMLKLIEERRTDKK